MNIHIYDTTLRDGAQREGISLTVADKLRIARRLDEFGVGEYHRIVVAPARGRGRVRNYSRQ